nr:hypothetical protein CFP56_37178 [Quercus suber]
MRHSNWMVTKFIRDNSRMHCMFLEKGVSKYWRSSRFWLHHKTSTGKCREFHANLMAPQTTRSCSGPLPAVFIYLQSHFETSRLDCLTTREYQQHYRGHCHATWPTVCTKSIHCFGVRSVTNLPQDTMDPSANASSSRAVREQPVSTPWKAESPNSPPRASPRALFGQENSIWGSPTPNATRSATMPAKAPWSVDASFGSALGVNFGGSPAAMKKQRDFTPPIPSPLRQTHDAKTSPFQAHKTYPLMQQEFGTPRSLADQPRSPLRSHKVDATTSFTMKTPGKSATRATVPGHWPSPPNQDDRALAVSMLSPHYLETNPELANVPAPVYRQDNHPQGWKRVVSVPGARIEEAFEGAHEIVRSLNPEYFLMPHGTRVVNIKTDHIENMHIAIQRGVWSTLDKVSRRIMVVWNARHSPEEKVLLLFAVNGSKSYCGLAEMSGSYDPEDSVDGWQGNSCVG